MNVTESKGRWQRMVPLFLSAVKFIIMTLLSRTPAGLSARILHRVGRKPLRIVLALVLEPLLSAIMKKFSSRLFREKHEEAAK